MTTLPSYATVTDKKGRFQRRLFLIFASFSVVYPLLSFLGFRTAKKPKIVKLQLNIKPGSYHIEPDFVLFESDKKVWAISRKCTHLGCTIHFREQARIFECPCHESRFSDMGVVLNGPAKRSLPKYRVEKLDEGNIYLVTL